VETSYNSYVRMSIRTLGKCRKLKWFLPSSPGRSRVFIWTAASLHDKGERAADEPIRRATLF